MKAKYFVILLISTALILISVYTLVGTNQNQDAYYQEIMKKRSQKNRDFKSALPNKSPLTKADKAHFTGLNYFEPNPMFRVQAVLEKSNTNTVASNPTSLKKTRQMKKYGKLKFKIKNQNFELTVFQNGLIKKMLFVPFTDETTGDQTYEAGRYLDFFIPENQNFTFDFNLAYNPYCAYNKNYECPLPPPENHLKIKIEAGEKIFKKHD